MQKFKRVLVVLTTAFLIVILLELLSKILIITALKNKINPDILRTEFEEIYVPPFEDKKPDDFWIFVYGGSTVQGLPLPKIGFTNQLQYQLNKVFESGNIKVFNLGWAGFNSTRIRYLLERTIDQKPDLIIVYTGENEFIYPQLDFYWLVKAVPAVKNRSSLGRLMMYVIKSIGTQDSQELFTSDKKFPAYGSNGLLVFLKQKIFETNMKMITDVTRKRQVPLLFGIPAHNISDWPPVRKEVTTARTTQDYQEAFQKAYTFIDNDKFQEAKNIIDHSLIDYPNDAPLLFLKATIEREKGSESKVLFSEAKDKDLVPWRTTTTHSDFIKSLANGEDVWVVDFAQVLSESSKDGLVGFYLILDGTHPTKEGAYLITKSLVEFIKQEKLINEKWLNASDDVYPMGELFTKMNITLQDDFFVFLKTAK